MPEVEKRQPMPPPPEAAPHPPLLSYLVPVPQHDHVEVAQTLDWAHQGAVLQGDRGDGQGAHTDEQDHLHAHMHVGGGGACEGWAGSTH